MCPGFERPARKAGGCSEIQQTLTLLRVSCLDKGGKPDTTTTMTDDDRRSRQAESRIRSGEKTTLKLSLCLYIIVPRN